MVMYNLLVKADARDAVPFLDPKKIESRQRNNNSVLVETLTEGLKGRSPASGSAKRNDFRESSKSQSRSISDKIVYSEVTNLERSNEIGSLPTDELLVTKENEVTTHNKTIFMRFESFVLSSIRPSAAEFNSSMEVSSISLKTSRKSPKRSKLAMRPYLERPSRTGAINLVAVPLSPPKDPAFKIFKYNSLRRDKLKKMLITDSSTRNFFSRNVLHNNLVTSKEISPDSSSSFKSVSSVLKHLLKTSRSSGSSGLLLRRSIINLNNSFRWLKKRKDDVLNSHATLHAKDPLLIICGVMLLLFLEFRTEILARVAK